MKPLALLLIALSFWPVTASQAQLSRSDRKERIRALNDTYRQFLLDVDPIIEGKERDAFLSLESDAQRDVFIENFWRRHAPAGMSGEAFRIQYYEVIEEASKYHRSTDRYRVYVIQGPPADIVDPDCQKYLQPMELWRYVNITGLGHDTTLLFYVPLHSTEYVLWHPMARNAYEELLTYEGAEQGVEAVFLGKLIPMTSMRDRPLIESDCKSSDLLRRTIALVAQSGTTQLKALEPRVVSEEPMKLLLRSMVMADPKAAKLTTEMSVRFPRKDGSRTDAEITVLVPRAQLAAKDLSGANTYSIDVTGEVLRDESMFEKYRYRFDLPANGNEDKLPLIIDRILPHGDYKFRMKIVDVNSGAEAIVERPVTVPEEAGTAEERQSKQSGSAVVSALKSAADAPETQLRIVPLPDEILSGLQHIETIAVGADIKAVEFYLDGRKIMTKRQPPYTLDLDFGSVPRARNVRAIALDAKGQPLTGDEVTLNTGTDPFRVRIVSPRVAIKLKGKTRVEMSVQVPEGKTLDNVQLYFNDKRVATLYGPPFVQTVDIPPTEGVGYLRAVATLKDDPTPPIEDVVMVNTPQYMEEVNVHLVELPTTVIVNGRPSSTLVENSFKVFDEGKPVKLAKFEAVKNLPLSIGMAVDTSGSMQPRMPEAQKAGASFFKNVLKAGDKAFLVSFDTQPQVVQKWSPNLSDMNTGLSKLRSEESTALYDAVVYSLYNFLGVKGQKALVLITDGEDTSSKFTFDQAIEYARRAAVPIYAIGLGIGGARVDVRFKLGKLSAETGGNVYYIDRADELGKIYADIQDELRSQYILGFYPAEDVKPGSKWHEVTVQVSEGKAKTIRGYYP